MLNDSYEYKEILCEFFIQNEINNIQLLPQSWDSCANLTQLLKIFENATKQLSGCYYPTSPLVVDHCVKIALIFSHYGNDPILSGPINNMKTKWVKYFYQIPDVFLIAKMLDPRMKEEGLLELLKMYYESLLLDIDPANVVANAKKVFYDLFKEYKIQFGGESSSESSDVNYSNQSSSSQSTINTLERFERLYEERSLKKPRGSSGNNTYGEIDRYFYTTFEELDFAHSNSLLRWWHKKSKAFPILSIIAKEILAVPASTVSVESAFSIGGNMLDDRRSRLTVENVENQCLLEDWTKAEKRQQEEDFDEDEEGDYVPWDCSTGSSDGDGHNA